MLFCVVNMARLMHGQHATTMLVNDHVNARLGSYGAGVAEVWVELVYPSRTPPKDDSAFETEIHRAAASCPRVTYRRAKRRIDVRVLSRGVGSRAICGDGHLTFDETTALTETVSAGLELIRPRVKPDDGFDVDAFLADAQAALAGCPKALRRYLTKK